MTRFYSFGLGIDTYNKKYYTTECINADGLIWTAFINICHDLSILLVFCKYEEVEVYDQLYKYYK